MDILLFIIRLLGFIIFVDFLTGFFHFVVDQYLSSDTPFIGKIVVENNHIHHSQPRKILENGYFKLTYVSWILGFVIFGICYAVGYYSLEFTLALAYGANANLVHQWTHKTVKENGKLITWLQDAKIVQSRRHHGWHHKAPYDVNYCILTDWLNPFLNRIQLWDGFMKIFAWFGLKPVVRD